MILIVTSKDDLTSDYLIRRIDERGVPLFRLNTEDLLSVFDVSLLVTDTDVGFKIWDRVCGTAISSSDIVGAYFLNQQKQSVPLESADYDYQSFYVRELVETLRSIWRLIPRNKWLNSPESLFLASNKIKQLTIAREIGFRVPETLVTTRPTDLLTFAKKHGNHVIAKAVKNGFSISHDTVSLIFTSMIDSSDYDSLANSDIAVPNIVQPRLEKECDLRITVVGNSVYPAAIRSQRHSATAIDWRTWDTVSDVDLVHEAFSLPNDIADMCRALNARLDLDFSCIDMVLARDGSFYFLEVNPNGQWAWIEEMVGLPIRDAIVDQLVRGKCCA